MNITELPGIGPKKAGRLARLNINTIEDLLYYFPKAYQDRTCCTDVADLEPGKAAMVHVLIKSAAKPFSYGRRGGKKSVLKLQTEDVTGKLEIVFFNAAYLSRNFRAGESMYFYGIPHLNKGRLQMAHPEFSEDMPEDGIVPVYPLTEGIGEREMRRFQREAQKFVPSVPDPLPEELVCGEDGIVPLHDALRWIHFAPDMEHVRLAERRLIYDELFILQIGIHLMRQRDRKGRSMKADPAPFIKAMKFPMTAAQERVCGEIRKDMTSENAMNRLVQGDVGSGKTAVAETALYEAAASGKQGAMMAPSGLLAKQHYENLKKDFEPFGMRIGLLTGNMPAAEKKKQLEELAEGKTDIIVGTHALLQPDVEFCDLGLVVTDEQHRFGVSQRKTLAEKGNTPDVLVMTATPIPRTMAVVMYGDMDISVIDQLPPGRKPVRTKTVTEKSEKKVMDFVLEEVRCGRQAYVVAPLVSDSEAVGAKSAEGLYEEITKRTGENARVGLVHGEMPQEERDSVMEAFAKGNIDILCATVVIEVGINVPNASVMVIENCERFGLAQLHQLRGRVGRGADQSYCILIIDPDAGDTAMSRAKTLTESNDGFFIAEQDLALRGPGEIFGQRQHGMPDMRLADMIRHMDIMEKCGKAASKLLESDPALEEHEELKRDVQRAFGPDVRMTM